MPDTVAAHGSVGRGGWFSSAMLQASRILSLDAGAIPHPHLQRCGLMANYVTLAEVRAS